MYTTILFIYFKRKFSLKEHYLNFFIEQHFNDHTLEKLNQTHDL